VKILDISWPLHSATTGYKNKKVIHFKQIKQFAQDNVRETTITLSSHSGTHVDAPAHFLRDGKTIDQLPLTHLIGRCKVIDLTSLSKCIFSEDLEKTTVAIDIKKDDIILLKTANSSIPATDAFSPDFIYLHSSGAHYLAKKKIKAVGIDYLGIERNQPDHTTHIELMKNNVIIIEGLRLHHVKQGIYTLYCLPLYTIGLEAAPARALLIKD